MMISRMFNHSDSRFTPARPTPVTTAFRAASGALFALVLYLALIPSAVHAFDVTWEHWLADNRDARPYFVGMHTTDWGIRVDGHRRQFPPYGTKFTFFRNGTVLLEDSFSTPDDGPIQENYYDLSDTGLTPGTTYTYTLRVTRTYKVWDSELQKRVPAQFTKIMKQDNPITLMIRKPLESSDLSVPLQGDKTQDINVGGKA